MFVEEGGNWGSRYCILYQDGNLVCAEPYEQNQAPAAGSSEALWVPRADRFVGLGGVGLITRSLPTEFMQCMCFLSRLELSGSRVRSQQSTLTAAPWLQRADRACVPKVL
jgi:hypothetical protein